MTVHLLAFARLRELLEARETPLVLADGATAQSAWDALAERVPALAPLGPSTRFACNGKLVVGDEVLHDGDELALLPPVGGG